MSIFEKVARLPDRVLLAWAIAALLVIGFVDFLAGWEVSLFFFYALPIFIVGFRFDQRLAMLFAIVTVLVWYTVNYRSHPYHSEIAFAWATASRGAYMVFVAYGGTLLSRYRESERARREAVEREADLRRSMLRDIEEQQRHFGRELHDGVCQLLSGTSLAIESLASRLESKLPAEATAVREIEGFIRKALAEGRDLAHGAFPVQMGSEGLPVALAELASMGDRMAEGVRVTFSQRGPTETVSPEIAMHLYRIAQEAMGNALRHAGARNVNIVLSSDARGLSVEVADDGSGIGSGSKSGPGIGLRTMAYRAAQIGARLEFLTRDRGGTRVICLLSKADGDTKRDTPPAS